MACKLILGNFAATELSDNLRERERERFFRSIRFK